MRMRKGMSGMIISASRRTDIPAFYGEWFMERLRAGYVLTRNPMRPQDVRRVSLLPGDVDAIVFWSKDMRPLMKHMDEIRARFPVCVQHTLTPYGAPLEPRLADKRGIVGSMRELGSVIGADCLVWRYDPIAFAPGMDVEWHLRAFGRACELLEGATHRCVFSFIQMYPRIRARMAALGVHAGDADMRRELMQGMSEIAAGHGISLQTCCQDETDLPMGISANAGCISPELIRAATGREVKTRRDAGQRGLCHCVKSVDIGAYHCCPHMCAYCYANWGEAAVLRNAARHDVHGEELLGRV